MSDCVKDHPEMVLPRVRGPALFLSGARFVPKLFCQYNALTGRFLRRGLAKQLLTVSFQGV